MPHHPFHYSFLVKDLESTRAFYGNTLGCKEGRSTETWVDFDFYGNQLSMHVSETMITPVLCGIVESKVVPIPHFGCIIPWDTFHSLAENLRGAGIKFIIEPNIRFAEEPGEQATMFFSDPSGNSIEIKSYKNPKHIFTPHKKHR